MCGGKVRSRCVLGAARHLHGHLCLWVPGSFGVVFEPLGVLAANFCCTGVRGSMFSMLVVFIAAGV